MATILLVGADDALLEGLAQLLGSAGHRVAQAHTIPEAIGVAAADLPLLAVVERRLAAAGADALRIPLHPGGSLVLFRGAADERPTLPLAVQRHTLADLTLPLERQRLVALAQRVSDRSAVTGRGRRDTPPEAPAID